MTKLVDVARGYTENDKKYGEQKALYHYNCAEVLLNSCNDYYNLGADSKLLKAIIPFGGGFYSERTCGALTGGIAALGLMYAEDKPTTNEKVKEMTKKWVEIFEKELGYLDCKDLKEVHRDPEKGCEPLILRAVELFEKLIESEKQ